MKKKRKTHKATVKRFKLTRTGKLRHKRKGDNAHLKANKSRAQKKRKKTVAVLSNKTEIRKLLRMMS